MNAESASKNSSRQDILNEIRGLVQIIEKNQRIRMLKENSIKLKETADALAIVFENQTTFANQQSTALQSACETTQTSLKSFGDQISAMITDNINVCMNLQTAQMIVDMEKMKNEVEHLRKENQTFRLTTVELELRNEKLEREIQKIRGASISELNMNLRQHKPVPFFPMSSGVRNALNKVSAEKSLF